MGTFGVVDRFSNAHSFLKNNPVLTGRLKKNNPSRNSDHFNELKIIKKSKTYTNLNILKIRSKNKNIKNITNNKINKEENSISCSRKKTNNLSRINNKSSSCVIPNSFNPLINYGINRDKKINNKRANLINNKKNNDHFYHMNPTELFKYKIQIKRKKINYHTITQILGLPGSKKNVDIFPKKKSGKKYFQLIYKNKESDEDTRRDINRNKLGYSYNATNNFMKLISKKIYEFDGPIISYKDIS